MRTPTCRFIEKRISIKLNGNRQIAGVLRGFDQFMNLVLENTTDLTIAKAETPIGTVVVRGNSVLMIEALEKI